MSALAASLTLSLINKVGGPARAIARDLEKVRQAVTGLASGQGADALKTGLDQVVQTAGKAATEVQAVRRAAEALGRTRGARGLKTGLADADTAAARTRTGVTGLKTAVDQLGQSRGADALKTDLDEVTQRAKAAREAVATVATTTPGSGNPGWGRPGAGRPGGVATATGEAAERVLPVPVTAGTAVAAGAAAGAAIVGAGAAAKFSVERSMAFEDAMGEVRKATDASGTTLDVLTKRITAISQETGIPATEVAQLVAQAGFAGRPSGDLPRFAEFSSKAAVAWGMSPEATGEALAQFGNIFKFNQAQLEALADRVNMLADTTAAREGDIVTFTKRTGQQGTIAGLSGADTAAAGASILSLGVPVDVASTSWETLITRLMTARDQTDRFQAGLERLGLSADTIEAGFARDGAATLVDVLKRIDALAPDKRMSTLVDMFGVEYADNIARLTAAVEMMETNIAAARNGAGAEGSVEKTYQIQADQTSAHLDRLSAAVDAAAVAVGDRMTPAIADFADWLAGKVNAFVDEQQAADLVEKYAGADGGELQRRQNTRLGGLDAVDLAAAGLSDRDIGGIDDPAAQRRAVRDRHIARLTKDIDDLRAELQLRDPTGRDQAMAGDRRRLAALEEELREARLLAATDTPESQGLSEAATTIAKLLDARRQLREAAASGDYETRRKATGDLNTNEQAIRDALSADGGKAAAEELIGAYADAIKAQGPVAAAAARAIAAELKSILDITLTPTVQPRLGSVPDKVGYGPGGKTPGGRQVAGAAVTNVYQINGAGDPAAVASAIERTQNRQVARLLGGALHDTGSLA